jgi:hypothetical protein
VGFGIEPQMSLLEVARLHHRAQPRPVVLGSMMDPYQLKLEVLTQCHSHHPQFVAYYNCKPKIEDGDYGIGFYLVYIFLCVMI